MPPDPRDIAAILEQNLGFDEPARWVDYALRHGFRRAKAVSVRCCPDCSAEPNGVVGQYIHYSNLIHLLDCPRCGLIWADVHIDPDVVRHHFALAYKDDEYFRESRGAIFEHLAALIERRAAHGARVLDIGGARGDLMQRVVARRPDVHVTIHDISEAATSWAAAEFGFATLNGDADVLAGHAEQYDIVVLSDVLYYEPKLKLLWSALSRLMRPGGTLIIRVPNKVALVQLGRLWLHLSRSRRRRLLQDRVPFFNPEQIFLFRRRYLLARLGQLGCSRIEVVPSPPLGGSIPAAVRSAAFGLASITSVVTRGMLVLTPAMLVIGSREETAPLPP